MAKIRTATTTDDTQTIQSVAAEPAYRGPSARQGLPNPQIPSQRSTNFDLMMHPQRWGWNDRLQRWWPLLGFFSHAPGVGGVTNRGELHHAEADLSARGWIILKRDDARFPARWRDYVRKTRIQGGREDEPIYVYHCQWMVPHPAGNRTRWTKDTAMEDAFVQDMLDKGLIPPMEEIIIGERSRAQLQVCRKIEDDIYANGGSPALEGRLKRERLKLARMRGEDEQEALTEIASVVARARTEGGNHSPGVDASATLSVQVEQLTKLVQQQAAQLAAMSTPVQPPPEPSPRDSWRKAEKGATS